MKTLSSALNTAYSGTLQKPAWLVEIGWTSTVRLSSYGTVTFGGYSWLGADIDVSRIRIDAAKVSGTLVLGNADDTYGALVLNEGVSDIPIAIYGYDAAATASGDFVQLVTCVGGKGVVAPDRVEIGLRDGNAYVYSPRTFVNTAPGSGFTHLLPAGTVLNINGQSYRLERR